MIKNHFPWNQQTLPSSQSLLELPLRTAVNINKIEALDPEPTTEKPVGLQLQLRDDIFMVTDVSSNTVLSYFKSSPRITLLIKVLQLGNNFKKEQEKQKGEGQGLIKITPLGHPQQEISFFFSFDHQKLIELYRTFPKTFTIQLDFHNVFKPVRKIGNGVSAVVYQVVRKVDQAILAVKAFKKSSYFQIGNGNGQEAFLQEFKLLSQCDHEGICRFEGTYETDNTIYLVQEYYQKSLSSLVSAQEDIPRKQVLSIMEDLLRAVSYLHSKGIFHRDIKLDNIMLRKCNDSFRPVLIDLGMAHSIYNSKFLFQKCGTPGYIAPQVFTQGAKHPKGDVFSLGVILHILLFKAPVFVGQSKEEVILNNRKGNMAFDQAKLQAEDELIRDLLLKMLQVDQDKRLTANQALEHRVFRPKGPLTPETNPPSEFGEEERTTFELVEEEDYIRQ